MNPWKIVRQRPVQSLVRGHKIARQFFSAAKHERTRARPNWTESIQIAFPKPCHFEKVFEQADLRGFITVGGD
jgi:hypothetical protein